MSTGTEGDDTPKVDREAAKAAALEMLQIEAELRACQFAERTSRGFPTRTEEEALALWKLRELRHMRDDLRFIGRMLASIDTRLDYDMPKKLGEAMGECTEALMRAIREIE